MGITGANLLTIAQALAARFSSVATLDWALPSPVDFVDKAEFWATFKSSNDTQKEIETDKVRAVWINYLKFEDSDRETDGPVKTLIYQFTVFSESAADRLDETVTPDAFNKQVKKTNHEHVSAIMAICDEFQGITPLGGMSEFATAETISVAQIDFTQNDVPCKFVPDIEGDQTNLECRVRIQLPC